MRRNLLTLFISSAMVLMKYDSLNDFMLNVDKDWKITNNNNNNKLKMLRQLKLSFMLKWVNDFASCERTTRLNAKYQMSDADS